MAIAPVKTLVRGCNQCRKTKTKPILVINAITTEGSFILIGFRPNKEMEIFCNM